MRLMQRSSDRRNWLDDPARYAWEHNNIYAAIVRTALFAIVRGERAILGVSGRRHLLRVELILLDEESGDGRRPGCGELPVGGKLCAVDRHLIGVSFDADLVGQRLEATRDSRDDGGRGGLVH